MSDGGTLSRKKMLQAFKALSAELEALGLKGELFVVGGAAMALAYNARRTTRDVDAIFEPKSAIYDAARTVAERLGLPDDWLNDAVKTFAPGSDHDGRIVFQTQHLQVTAASPEYLLAMKLLAARVDRDTEDIRTLYKILGFSTADEGLDLVERFYPRKQLEVRTQFLLEEMFGPTAQRPGAPFEIDQLAANPGSAAEGGRQSMSISQAQPDPTTPARVYRCERSNLDGSRCKTLPRFFSQRDHATDDWVSRRKR